MLLFVRDGQVWCQLEHNATIAVLPADEHAGRVARHNRVQFQVPAQAIPLDQLRQYAAPGVHSGSEPGDKPVPALIIQHEIRIQHAPIVADAAAIA
jgi:hypothetical protein